MPSLKWQWFHDDRSYGFFRYIHMHSWGRLTLLLPGRGSDEVGFESIFEARSGGCGEGEGLAVVASRKQVRHGKELVLS